MAQMTIEYYENSPVSVTNGSVIEGVQIGRAHV